MISKFNKFTTLFETAFSTFTNGGFREGSPVILLPSFLKSKYFKKHYSGHENFVTFLKQLVDDKIMFFIKHVATGHPTQNIKDANDNEGASNVFLILRTDPRVVQWPTEFNEFTIPGDFEYIKVVDNGINLPPVQGVPNRYERPYYSTAKVYKMEGDVDNRPQDDALPSKNTVLPHTSPEKDKKLKTNKPKPYKK
jgi:hypothetical protein